ncbi:hypothetical protein ANCCAN_27058 [Ancylostoma caninum]|uniref:Amine oxidase domain-containing protein n=1 Tax=Ancylostoma caninum TaxID=29170 RepID=A0A368F832_ANCCA|nr:hypothetical protein ANCCAN_27058 [Ancylostoma caninum]
MRRGFHTYFRRCASTTPKDTYDVVVAAYLARAGKRVCVLERREVLGGAAVTEEIIPGFKFSRASYLLSLLRPTVIKDLDLKVIAQPRVGTPQCAVVQAQLRLLEEHGLRYHIRNPYSFTPIRNLKESLLLGHNVQENCSEIAKFSERDAEMFPKYEEFIERTARPLESMMDEAPINVRQLSKWELLKKSWPLVRRVQQMGISNVVDFYELMTAPIAKIMNRWFESDVLKATIGTDGVIGFAASPYDAGTGYVLLHHVLGGVDNRGGAWAYVIGGMGAVSTAIAKSAKSHGAEIFVEQVCPFAVVSSVPSWMLSAPSRF